MPPLPLTLSESLIALWIFAMGGAIGSFLNVVVYRLPAGLSINLPPSHCPSCKHPIRWHDNLPILGWIVLGGRCRDCRERFSIRYPVVEAGSAAIFLAVGIVEGFSGGANLPAGPELLDADTLLFALTGQQLAGLVAWHLLLLCTLAAAALIEFDGQTPPVRLFTPVAVAGIIAPAIWPHLHPVPAIIGLEGPISGLTNSTAGLAAGLLGGLAAAYLVEPTQKRGLLAAVTCTGLSLGWQAAIGLAILTVLSLLLTRSLQRVLPVLGKIPPTAYLSVGSLVWILFWNHLPQWPVFLSHASP